MKEKGTFKAASQEEKPQKWNKYFKNLLGNLPEITDKPTKLDFKLGHFLKEELNTILKKIKSGKVGGLNKTPLKYERQGN